ncbi:UDP-N-acetylglucosamine 2-epimerase (non-hydrolyzing) [Candidatus Peregrinibacteria bacterium]|jgi:UDP-N-acetylglucosamine 2-epimerase (non-hydrolysing)|nr:UDP-N-acetylglucosamine 2-epimerase (non-hydrolyzing) [Candidatus Peregrinibacteria bacterium]MBT4056228.1 UDP-N-acetylglucosamine 2-epimerase (non-hydrolyzing) [Candidatus Peregrinibacteria bacterium]
MKIAVVFGTRPEIIKLSPVIRALEKFNADYFIIHTNQHYDENMDSIFLQELELPKPKYNLGIGSGTHANMTGKMLIEVEKIFLEEKPDLLIVQGDTNTVLAVSLAASKMHINIAHVEAGLRSYTKIPEETNRILTDRISDYCFTPTKKQETILKNEGIEEEKIHIVGNTIVDAAFQNLEIAKQKPDNLLKKLDFKPENYILLTTHREENVDNKTKLQDILTATDTISTKNNLPVVFPIHPRTQKNIEKFNIQIPQSIKTIEPTGYLDMLTLIQNAKLILTDSGGIQEEACILQTPCLTLRESTERPETVEVGGNIITDTNKEKIVEESQNIMNKNIDWKNPFGNGNTGELIVKTFL